MATNEQFSIKQGQIRIQEVEEAEGEEWVTLLEEAEEAWGKGLEEEGSVKQKSYHPKICSDSSLIKEGAGLEEEGDQWEEGLEGHSEEEEDSNFMVQAEFECKLEEVNREELVNLNLHKTRLQLSYRSLHYCSSYLSA